LALSISSPSTPPSAARRFSTRVMYGIEVLRTRTDPLATLPRRPPPIR